VRRRRRMDNVLHSVCTRATASGTGCREGDLQARRSQLLKAEAQPRLRTLPDGEVKTERLVALAPVVADSLIRLNDEYLYSKRLKTSSQDETAAEGRRSQR
jgi:hypothetical protein